MLVEPAGPLNIGSVARLCANFGVSELRLVAPRCNHLSEEAMLMAVHSHLQSLFAEMVTARCHQPQFGYTEIGAKPGHASDVQGPGWLHQHDDGIQGSGSAEGVQVGQQIGH